jgi:hypothetical protein
VEPSDEQLTRKILVGSKTVKLHQDCPLSEEGRIDPIERSFERLNEQLLLDPRASTVGDLRRRRATGKRQAQPEAGSPQDGTFSPSTHLAISAFLIVREKF